MEERKLWEDDSLITMDGSFDFYLLNPVYRHTSGSAAMEVEFAFFLRQFLDPDTIWSQNGRYLCEVSKEEWGRSGWDKVRQNLLETTRPLPLFEQGIEVDLGDFMGRKMTGRISMMWMREPPHRFGMDICDIRRAAEEEFRRHAGKQLFVVPTSISWLAGSWAMLLATFIAVRLLKTTIELRKP